MGSEMCIRDRCCICISILCAVSLLVLSVFFYRERTSEWGEPLFPRLFARGDAKREAMGYIYDGMSKRKHSVIAHTTRQASQPASLSPPSHFPPASLDAFLNLRLLMGDVPVCPCAGEYVWSRVSNYTRLLLDS